CLFFQAEDGIRDRDVTGVQTCALPISGRTWKFSIMAIQVRPVGRPLPLSVRSEERRVGKSVDLGGRRIIKKKDIKTAGSSNTVGLGCVRRAALAPACVTC